MNDDVKGGATEPGRLARKIVHDGRIVHLSVDEVRFPNGSVGELELVRHAGASAVLPVVSSLEDDDPEVLLLRQYRYATGGYLWEVPAGMPRMPGEPWEECARRELEEETGRKAASLRPLTRIFTTPGFSDEVIHLYLATGLSEGRSKLDDDEFLEVVRMPLSKAVEMVRRGDIVDCKSIATILYVAHFLASEAKGA
jgi:ADP-ribose pyrophosphatase